LHGASDIVRFDAETLEPFPRSGRELVEALGERPGSALDQDEVVALDEDQRITGLRCQMPEDLGSDLVEAVS
jgi:hypothetical protein